MTNRLPERVRQFPKKPGVYLMKDAENRHLYIGKAKHLRSRVSSYFKNQAKKERYQIDFLMRKVSDIEFIVTDNEKEALLLENTLIKQHQPRYNLFLKDDKNFLSLKINERHAFPGLFVTRKIVKDGSSYYGPYTSASALRETVEFLTRHFQLRTCADREFANRSRPCLEYHLKRCSAPCVGLVALERYRQQIEETKLFLKGSKADLAKMLAVRMAVASEMQHYEEAARIRDVLAHIRTTLEKQKMVQHTGGDYDAIGLAEGEKAIAFCVLMIRHGVLIERKRFIFLRAIGTGTELLEQFILQYYSGTVDVPPQIVVGEKLEIKKVGQVGILHVKRGMQAKMLALAAQNARLYVETKRVLDAETLLENLQKKLELAVVPHTIECVDISNIQGKQAVGSLVTFTDGVPNKSRYRKFKIRLPEEPNDYAMMFEVLSRRFHRALENENATTTDKWVWPDLLMVDGGKGHLQIALRALNDLGIHQLPVIAIAKPHTIYLPDRKNPVSLSPGSQELLYLMRIRDEAHRFGITYHRNLRSKKLLSRTHQEPKI